MRPSEQHISDAANAVTIPVSGATVPPTVHEYEVTVKVADRTFPERFTPTPDTKVLFAWDGKDASGEVPLGAQLATIEVAEIYNVNGVDVPWNVKTWGGTPGS